MGRKYIHGFFKSRLMELGINHDQSLVIRHILDFMKSNKMTTLIHDGEMYYWVKYDKVASDLDILGLKKQAISDMIIYDLCEKPLDWDERLSSMSESTRKKRIKSKFIGLFKRYTKKDSEGTYSYFAPTDLIYTLEEPITENDSDMLLNGNKKASNGGTKEATQKSKKINNSNSSICESDKNNTSNKEKNKQVNNVKEDSEVVKLLKDNKITGIKTTEADELFADVNILNIAIEECIRRNKKSYGYLKMVYETKSEEVNSASNNMKPRNQQRVEMINNFAKGASSNVNNNFTKYTEKELEEMLQESQKGKFD